MDDRLRICLWIVGGGGFGSVVGGGFGALTATLYARSGGAAGTRLARQVVDNFLQSGEHQPLPIGRAALIGAADGSFFLGTLGLVAGVFLGKTGLTGEELLLPIVMGSVAVIGGAIFFGTLAYAITSHTAEFLYGSFGFFLGGFLASMLLGSSYGPVGCVPGMVIGLFLCRAVRRSSPRFHPPRFRNELPARCSQADTDIAGPSLVRPGSDDIRKSNTDER